MVFWDKRSLELVDLEVGLFSVLCRFKNVEDGFLWNFPKVYGSVLSSLREDFWDELGATRVLGGWGGGGAFNVFRTPSECSKGGQISFSLRRFSIVIEDLGLKDLPLQGSNFTHAAGYDLKDLGTETVTIAPSLIWISS